MYKQDGKQMKTVPVFPRLCCCNTLHAQHIFEAEGRGTRAESMPKGSKCLAHSVMLQRAKQGNANAILVYMQPDCALQCMIHSEA